jgi:hypothetical protein
LTAPFLDQDLSFAKGEEDHALEEFIAKPGFKALARPIP